MKHILNDHTIFQVLVLLIYKRLDHNESGRDKHIRSFWSMLFRLTIRTKLYLPFPSLCFFLSDQEVRIFCIVVGQLCWYMDRRGPWMFSNSTDSLFLKYANFGISHWSSSCVFANFILTSKNNEDIIPKFIALRISFSWVHKFLVMLITEIVKCARSSENWLCLCSSCSPHVLVRFEINILTPKGLE